MGRSTASNPRQIDPPAVPETVDHRIAALAARQHGLVTVVQLEELGLSRRAAQDRGRAGRLHRIHRGVYAVGHTALSPDGRRMAAVLACGDGAVLSYRSAARMWGFVGGDDFRTDVTTPSRSGHAGPPDVTLHRTRRLDAEDVTTVRGVPITTVARTIIDLADILTRDRLDSAVHEAEVLRRLDVDALHRSAERLPGRRGLDGAAVHQTRRAFERDRAKDAALAALGYVVVRITWRRLCDDPGAVAAELRQTLRARMTQFQDTSSRSPGTFITGRAHGQ